MVEIIIIAYYLCASLAAIWALIGKEVFTIIYIIPLLSMQNLLEKIHRFPFGNDLLDILFGVLIIGRFINKSKNENGFITKTELNWSIFMLIIVGLVSSLRGGSALLPL